MTTNTRNDHGAVRGSENIIAMRDRVWPITSRWAWLSWLPKPLYAIGIQDAIRADKRNSFRKRLGDQEAVKRIFVMQFHRGQKSRVFWFDGQIRKSFAKMFDSMNVWYGSGSAYLPSLILIAISQ
jgi:hypothetical protein